jgi:hypothetical protein
LIFGTSLLQSRHGGHHDSESKCITRVRMECGFAVRSSPAITSAGRTSAATASHLALSELTAYNQLDGPSRNRLSGTLRGFFTNGRNELTGVGDTTSRRAELGRKWELRRRSRVPTELGLSFRSRDLHRSS